MQRFPWGQKFELPLAAPVKRLQLKWELQLRCRLQRLWRWWEMR